MINVICLYCLYNTLCEGNSAPIKEPNITILSLDGQALARSLTQHALSHRIYQVRQLPGGEPTDIAGKAGPSLTVHPLSVILTAGRRVVASGAGVGWSTASVQTVSTIEGSGRSGVLVKTVRQ